VSFVAVGQSGEHRDNAGICSSSAGCLDPKEFGVEMTRSRTPVKSAQSNRNIEICPRVMPGNDVLNLSDVSGAGGGIAGAVGSRMVIRGEGPMAIKRPTKSRGTPSHKPVASAPLRHVDVRAPQQMLPGEVYGG